MSTHQMEMNNFRLLGFPQRESLVGIICLLISLLFYRVVYANFFAPLRDIPGPVLARYTRLWELYTTWRGDSHETIPRLHQRYGSVIRQSPNLYSFNSREDLKKIYNLDGKFRKSDRYTSSNVPGQPSIFSTTDEDDHKDRKRKIGSLYSMSNMVNYEDSVDRMTAVCLRKFANFAQDKTRISVPRFMQFYAFDTIGELTVDQNFGMMETETDTGGLIGTVQNGTIYLGLVGIFPDFHWVIYHIRRLLGYQGRASFMSNIVAKQREEHRQHLIEKADPRADPFITKLLRLETAGKIQLMHFRDSIGSNLIAGSETIGITLSAALYYIYSTPRVLLALREEIDSLAAEGRISDPLSFKDGQSMPYLQAVILETLRIHPAIGFILSRVVPKGGVELAGRHFPEGTIVGVNAWSLHSNPDLFGEDCRDFRPERFLGQELANERFATSFAFGDGTRTCLGKNIALLELTKLIPQLVRNFEFVFENEEPWKLFSTGFVWPEYYCYIEPRESVRSG